MVRYKSWVTFLTFFLFIAYVIDIQAQDFSKEVKIIWQKPTKINLNETEVIQVFSFNNRILGNPTSELPQYFESFSVHNLYNEYTYEISNLKTSPLNTLEQQAIPKDIKVSYLNISLNTVSSRGEPFLQISFTPIINKGGRLEKVLSFNLQFSGKGSAQKSINKSGSTQSIFSSGTWYSISVTKSGIHKITYANLQSLGVPVQGLSSSHISVFGNGGAMLPEANNALSYDNPQENAIQIMDGGDGVFNEGDYILFYAQGPHSWNYDKKYEEFSHQYNIYNNKAHYYITIDSNIGEKRRVSATPQTKNANKQETTGYFLDFYERDEVNTIEAGRDWFFQPFDGINTIDANFTLPGTPVAPLSIGLRAAVDTRLSSSLEVSVNNDAPINISLNGNYSGYLKTTETERNFSITSNTVNVSVDYNKPSSSASALCYLDWIELQGYFSLNMGLPQFMFISPNTIGEGNVTTFTLTNASAETAIWDVTQHISPQVLPVSLTGSQLQFTAPTDSLVKFVAFSPSAAYAVTTEGKVNNQNIIAEGMVDYIMICHPNFLAEANRLAEYRRTNDGLTVKVITPEQVYHQFSSGSLDPTAIRNYMRAVYRASNQMYPQYLLLFGRGTFDYREIMEGNKMFVPNYQSPSIAIAEKDLRSCDDYFALLDDEEQFEAKLYGAYDIAVGRFPVMNATHAITAVDKTLNYCSLNNLLTEDDTRVSNLADWKNIVVFVADDEDSSNHILRSDATADSMENNFPVLNVEKIYLDAYPQQSYAGGQRYPDVNRAIADRIDRGFLAMCYTGHGSPNGWAHERVLETSDINKWKNKFNQSLLITLTCTFGWYDRSILSPAEMIFFNPNGGASSLISTSRVAFMGANDNYGEYLFKHILDPYKSRTQTIGEMNRFAKNNTGGARNVSLNMIYVIGDPAMRLAYPKFNIKTTAINGVDIEHFADTLKALEKVTIKGEIVNEEGTRLEQFNGSLFPTIFDKKTTLASLGQDPGSFPIVEFKVQKNILFKGNVSVKDGAFEFSYIMPKDIDYEYGNGKLSYYARANEALGDANGYYNEVMIGGVSETPIQDSIGPEIEVFLNNENFVNGGITNPNPILLVNLFDDNGINTTGGGIGHDLVAILDNDIENPYVLNDYYQTTKDEYNEGALRFPLEELPIGDHQIKIKAWDIANNMSEQTIDFRVISDEKLTLDHVLNYPNPFTTKTAFYFEHNQQGDVFDIIVQIYTISGKVVTTLEAQQSLLGNRSEPIYWDGRDQFGDPLAKGVYIYRLKVRNSMGEVAEKLEKLVIL